jgi:hypothetical protein
MSFTQTALSQMARESALRITTDADIEVKFRTSCGGEFEIPEGLVAFS